MPDSALDPTPRVSIAIPTYNGIDYITQLLAAVFEQATLFAFEVIIIDSGSTDGTVEAIRRFPEVHLHQIPNAEYGHGRTRNQLTAMARGEIVVFLTQDAVPATADWLVEMVRPFDEIGPTLGAVFGKQIPRPDCCPPVKRDVLAAFESFGGNHGITIQSFRPDLPQAEQDALGFLSNVNSAARKSVLEEIPFEDLRYAEDQAFGRSVIKAGYLKAYIPSATVLHSHSFGPRDYFGRMIDEFNGLRESIGYVPVISRSQVATGWIRPTLRDLGSLVNDADYPWRRKVYWSARVPAINAGRYAAMYLAGHPNADFIRSRFSLEERRRSGHDSA